MQLAQAIALIQSDPFRFLQTEYVVMIGSGGSHSAGDTICKMSARTGRGGGWMITVHDQNNPRTLAQDEFRAWYIPMQQLAGMSANRLPDPASSTITLMVTSQVTACVFGVGRDASGTIVAHIQPDQKGHMNIDDGKTREQFRQSDARMQARVAGMGPLLAKYSTYDEMESVTVLGKRDANGLWTIHAQKHDHCAFTITGLVQL
jgi:lipoprotein-anchoring transpeptidase ErfK/SrfK